MLDVQTILQEISASWQSGQYEKLASYFHADMVIVGPGYQEFGHGRDACVASYREFMSSSVLRAYRESDLVVRQWKTTAVATYSWEIDYEQGGRLNRERGTDLFVFERHGEQWLAVWRAITFSPRGD